jgi:hypothetical protein
MGFATSAVSPHEARRAVPADERAGAVSCMARIDVIFIDNLVSTALI